MQNNINRNQHPSVTFTPCAPNELPEEFLQANQFGYYLINDQLVSYQFLALLTKHLTGTMHCYDSVLSVKHICGEELWSSLDEDERKIAGPCLLTLIQNEHILITLTDDEWQ